MKKVVYTVLLGDYQLKEPTYINKDWSHICFSDRDRVSKNWSIIKIEADDSRKKSREIKLRCDKYLDFDVCIYIDSKFTIKCNLDDFVKQNHKSDLTLMRHNKRSCAYDEAEFCIKIGKDTKEIISKQIDVYWQEKFPKEFGLYAPGIMIRTNSHEVISFMKLWHNEVAKHSYRDIISFSYVLWKNPIEISTIDFRKTYRRFT